MSRVVDAYERYSAPFVRTWQRVVERHPVLRSRLRWEGVTEPVQDVLMAEPSYPAEIKTQ
jgi:hypothetical protein